MSFGTRLRTCLIFIVGLLYGWFYATWQILIKIPVTFTEPNQVLLFWEIWISYLVVMISAMVFLLLLEPSGTRSE